LFGQGRYSVQSLLVRIPSIERFGTLFTDAIVCVIQISICFNVRKESKYKISIDHNTRKQILARIKMSKATLHHGVQNDIIAKDSTERDKL
jgi:hypothetical protein